MRIGYLRVNRSLDFTASETAHLEEENCQQILMDSTRHKISPLLMSKLTTMTGGDELIVERLDHIAPMPQLIGILLDLSDRHISVKSLSDGFDPSEEHAEAMLRAFAPYCRGTSFAAPGRRPMLDEVTRERARRMIEVEKLSVSKVARVIGVSRATIYRNLSISRPAKATNTV